MSDPVDEAYYDELDEQEDDDWQDEFDEYMNGCNIWRCDGVWTCGAVGSEECDECPHNVQIGRKRWYTPSAASGAQRRGE